MTHLYALGIGVGSQNRKGEWLEVFYPQPILNPATNITNAIAGIIDTDAELTSLSQSQIGALAEALATANEVALSQHVRNMAPSKGKVLVCALKQDSPPDDTPSAYLKLHLLSHRLCKPHETDISGIFAVLPNVVWSSAGAIDIDELTERQLAARRDGTALQIHSIDKFPRMTDYVVPSGVRIGDASRVRLGAYLGTGTTVMHEGFVNFNAGCEGPNMIEGRISAGVFVGAGSDLGGGCSTMGTLSGGGNLVNSIGKDCLVGANAGIGIPLGDGCTVEAGLYLTAGTKVQVLDDSGKPVEIVKAAELLGKSQLLFRRNSQSGAVQCLTNKSAVELNAELHSHN